MPSLADHYFFSSLLSSFAAGQRLTPTCGLHCMERAANVQRGLPCNAQAASPHSRQSEGRQTMPSALDPFYEPLLAR